MKKFTKFLGMVLVIALVISMSAMTLEAEAEPSTVPAHTITAKNTDEHAKHVYEAYQVFAGDYDAKENNLSNIVWGSGVNGNGLLTALKEIDAFAEADSATEVAGILGGTWGETAANVVTFSEVVGKYLTTVAGTSTQDKTPYIIEVYGDGYYFVKDKDASVTAGEHYTKFMLQVIKNTEVVAKDTHTTSDKYIVEDNNNVNDNDAAIGDTITYVSSLTPVPDPTRYNRYKLEMRDIMEVGLTFTGIDGIYLDYPDGKTKKSLAFSEDYDLYINDELHNEFCGYTTGENPQPVKPLADPVDKDAPTGATNIRIVFKNVKELIGNNDAQDNAVGGTLRVYYTAVLNKNAEIAPNSNDNTVHFVYSNNPNKVYEGDEIIFNDVTGETPSKTVETYTTTLEVLKTDAKDNHSLEGAIFTIESQEFNVTLVTAEVFEKDATGEYWALVDGSYTKTDPKTVTDKTQYVDPLTKYKKVTYTREVLEPETKTYKVCSDANGKIFLEGVKAGTYIIKEIAAPDGYNLLLDETKIVIDWNYVHSVATWESPEATEKTNANGGFSLGNGSSSSVTMKDNGTKFSVTIENHSGTLLPGTGGIGTTIFYVVGSIMVVAAGVLLITKKRMGGDR